MKVKGKHLTLNDRTYIEDALCENYSLKYIANYLGKYPPTISKEVRQNKVTTGQIRLEDHTHLSCNKRSTCNKKHICTTKCDYMCKKCNTFIRSNNTQDK